MDFRKNILNTGGKSACQNALKPFSIVIIAEFKMQRKRLNVFSLNRGVINHLFLLCGRHIYCYQTIKSGPKWATAAANTIKPLKQVISLWGLISRIWKESANTSQVFCALLHVYQLQPGLKSATQLSLFCLCILRWFISQGKISYSDLRSVSEDIHAVSSPPLIFLTALSLSGVTWREYIWANTKDFRGVEQEEFKFWKFDQLYSSLILSPLLLIDQGTLQHCSQYFVEE